MNLEYKLQNGLFQELLSTSTLFNDGDWVESKDQDNDGNVRLIQLADIGDGRFLNKSKRFMNIETAKKLNCTFLRKNDILIARMPDPLGRCCLFPFDEDEKYVTVVDIAILRIKPDYSQSYIQYLINTSQVRHVIEGQVTGTTRKRITRKNLKKLKIPLPPLAEQQKIAAILDAADSLRQKDQQLIALYTALSQSLFLEMFGDPVTNPMGWDKVHLNKLCLFKKTSVIPENIIQGTKYLALEDIEKETGRIINYQLVDERELKSNKFSFDEDTVLYGKLRPYLNKVALPSFKGICSTEIIPLKPLLSETNKYFIAQIMRWSGFVMFADERSSGANLPRISPKKVEEYPTIKPPLALQNQFAKTIQSIEAQKQQAQASLQKSDTLFNSLLQRAFKGELT